MEIIKTDVESLDHYIERLERENLDRAVLLRNDKMKIFIDNNPTSYYDIAKMAEHRNILQKEWTVVQKILIDLRQVSNGQKARLDSLFQGEKA
jgi:replicative DNA helicase